MLAMPIYPASKHVVNQHNLGFPKKFVDNLELIIGSIRFIMKPSYTLQLLFRLLSVRNGSMGLFCFCNLYQISVR